MDFSELARQLESDLKAGQVSNVHSLIADIRPVDIPSDQRLPIANICRRAGVPQFGLQILATEINPNRFADLTGADIELAIEYCLCLKEIGAINEAQLMLTKLNADRFSSLYECEINLAFTQSDFARVIEAADSYLARFDNATYSAAVIQLNRAAAKVALGHIEEAKSGLFGMEKWFRSENWVRLCGNCQELLTQIDIQQNDYAAARKRLDAIAQLGIATALKDNLFVRRWQAVIEARETGDISGLLHFKQSIKDHYETLRAVDYEIIKIDFSQSRFDFLYYGTPFSCYRKILEDEFGTASNCYVIHPEADNELCLQSGEFNQKPVLAVGGKMMLLLTALLSDFYRPIRIGTIFDKVFTEESFDPQHSVNKIHQLLYRTRQWIADHHLPLRIVETEKVYQLIFTDPLRVSIAKRPAATRAEFMLTKLKAAFSCDYFSAQEAESVLEAGHSTVNRVIVHGIDIQSIKRSGHGRNTRYFFTT